MNNLYVFRNNDISTRKHVMLTHQLDTSSTDRCTKMANTLQSNPSCRSGMLTHSQVFKTPFGPSLGPEMLVMILADEQWGDMFWYPIPPVERPRIRGFFDKHNVD
jgi:hypothetical protein